MDQKPLTKSMRKIAKMNKKIEQLLNIRNNLAKEIKIKQAKRKRTTSHITVLRGRIKKEIVAQIGHTDEKE